LIIVTILKSWNSCHKGTNLILRIGLGSHEFGVPLLVHLSLWVECADMSLRTGLPHKIEYKRIWMMSGWLAYGAVVCRIFEVGRYRMAEKICRPGFTYD
jgi:hypothetical protein